MLKTVTRSALVDMIEIEFERPPGSRDYTKVTSASLALIADALQRIDDTIIRMEK